MSTATVETLTAEVRVLMVGNRQITLSVYRQLDEVDPPTLEPFGRVRDKPAKQGTPSGIWLIGRDRDTGELVRAEVLTGLGEHKRECQGVKTIASDRTMMAWVKGCRYADVHAETDKRHAEARKLPLIVLAGLR